MPALVAWLVEALGASLVTWAVQLRIVGCHVRDRGAADQGVFDQSNERAYSADGGFVGVYESRCCYDDDLIGVRGRGIF
jgi:hypothetical protein